MEPFCFCPLKDLLKDLRSKGISSRGLSIFGETEEVVPVHATHSYCSHGHTPANNAVQPKDSY